MRCPKCSYEFTNVGLTRCPSCGAEVARSASAPMTAGYASQPAGMPTMPLQALDSDAARLFGETSEPLFRDEPPPPPARNYESLPGAPPGSPRAVANTMQGMAVSDPELAITGKHKPFRPAAHDDATADRYAPLGGLRTLPTGMEAIRDEPDHVAGRTLPPEPIAALDNAALQRRPSTTDPLGLVGSTALVPDDSSDDEDTDVKSVASRAAIARTAPMHEIEALSTRMPSAPTLPPAPAMLQSEPNERDEDPEPPLASEASQPTLPPAPPAPVRVSPGATGDRLGDSLNMTGPRRVQSDARPAPPPARPPARKRREAPTAHVAPVTGRGSRTGLILLWSLAIGAAITAVVVLLLLR